MKLKEKNSLILSEILMHSFDEIFVVDHTGKIIYSTPQVEKLFGLTDIDMELDTIFELEKKGVFSPSVIVAVLQGKKEATVIQRTIDGRKRISAGYPIFDNDELIGAISISRDMTEFDYLKDENEQVANMLKQYQQENRALKLQMNRFFPTTNSKMLKIFDVITKVAAVNISMLLEGESGVGKNYLARFIHDLSPRAKEPFLEINCGAISENLIESELFGYEDGAFTGAKKGGKKGYFESAKNGTLFLDEIGELPLHLQVKLLSVLQSQMFMKVGGSKSIPMACRVIFATNQNLEQMVHNKQFREDLFYRINVVRIEIPPLRERKDEIISLIYDITNEFNLKYGRNNYFTADMIAWMSQQSWPGNIRALRNYIEKVMITSETEEISRSEKDELVATSDKSESTTEQSLKDYLENVEKEYIIQLYKKYPSSIKLGRKLGISQSTANRKIQKYVFGH
ncbi:sigma-54 interaction domain-containing protein [Kurthia sibirica]|uniref:HTH-type transcriptional regulatory protein TyrR n=1 Tax=Kurthia sibirica TaxID=202750 RepID=A0A2U3AGP8_9BACL|nr:sigma 54-interacting transcriptional regulator [Kurthia sibirica]PWI23700.1 Fis family transcriptional regulator [Kurthia sibirica]GEK35245.1 RNA polymerase subunit sigma-54 [Kurthia sibirica]